MNPVRIDRTFAAPPERVWHALTDPSALTRWFWPASMAPVVSVDLRPGGALRIEAPGLMAVAGEYTVIEPPRVLAFTWRWEGEPELTTVRVELSPVDDGTRMVLTHDGFADDKTRDNHETGWRDCLKRLSARLAAGHACADARASGVHDGET